MGRHREIPLTLGALPDDFHGQWKYHLNKKAMKEFKNEVFERFRVLEAHCGIVRPPPPPPPTPRTERLRQTRPGPVGG